MKYFSCSLIEAFALNFNGRIDIKPKCITLCCENVGHLTPPAIPFSDTAGETIDNFIRMRKKLIAESKRLQDKGGKRIWTNACAHCANYQEREWTSDSFIHYVNLSMYPAPCQCKCIYCHALDGQTGVNYDSAVSEAYQKLFDVIEYAKKYRLIARDAIWQVSTGEITIHPFKDKIMDLVEGQQAMFYTNCFIFDERIAENLKSNPNSAINLSIDAGTPQTWYKVKGFHNFEKVTSNLVQYYANSARPGQITLKYIILPGINDNLEDYLSVIEIMKVLKANHLTLSRDSSIKYQIQEQQKETLLNAAALLLALCQKNHITNDMFTYTPEERKTAVALASELLRSGRV